MKILLVNKEDGNIRQLTLGGLTRAFLSICMLGLPIGLGAYIGHKWITDEPAPDVLSADTAGKWKQNLEEQKQQVADTRQNAEMQLNAITLRMAELQARLVRLDALGERLTIMAKLDKGEFDFNQVPAVGGPETDSLGQAYQAPDFLQTVDQLIEQIDDREQQLETLEALMAKRKLQDEAFIAGRPVKKGWLSSRFGPRADPFTGAMSLHNGVDFAGKMGSDIIAVAAGIVTESGERSGYGGFIEINHGGGFKTRYAHNKKNLVKVGDVVKRGQVIALMGTTGRSTGPHVHFEVHKHGRVVDPASYIQRTLR